MPPKHENINKGPTGGTYRNDCNDAVQGGVMQHHDEATSHTGSFIDEAMANLADHALPHEERQAGEAEMTGGNRGTSA